MKQEADNRTVLYLEYSIGIWGEGGHVYLAPGGCTSSQGSAS